MVSFSHSLLFTVGPRGRAKSCLWPHCLQQYPKTTPGLKQWWFVIEVTGIFSIICKMWLDSSVENVAVFIVLLHTVWVQISKTVCLPWSPLTSSCNQVALPGKIGRRTGCHQQHPAKSLPRSRNSMHQGVEKKGQQYMDRLSFPYY